MENMEDIEIQDNQTQAEKEVKAKKEEKNNLPYETASTCIPLGAVVPTKLAYETIVALNKFSGNGIDTSEFVRAKLNYESRVMVCKAFSAEQVDAIALAINQIDNGNGFILGDSTGVGKGRIVAAILRYAKIINKIPIFFSCGVNLFSDIYRDFFHIGGFSDKVPAVNVHTLPNPFILNSDGLIYDLMGIDDSNETPIYRPLSKKATLDEIRKNSGRLPSGYDLLMLTYSQLSRDVDKAANANAIAQYEYILSLAPNAIMVLDESHKGAGTSNLGRNLNNIIAQTSGIMFSSATYSKVPKSMLLYIPKTDMKDSNISIETIENAVEKNGEVVQEYLAGLLVKSGQMIRRERTFANCNIDYDYMPFADKPHYYNLYDKIIALYNEIEAFTDTLLYKAARLAAIERYAKELGIEIVSEDDKKPSKKEDKSDWEWENRNKYTVTYTTTNVLKNRFQWIENLLFAIKADFVATKVIKELKSRKKVIYTKGKDSYEVKTNYKPIIAVRNTGEAGLNTLGYKVGQTLTPEQNDYAKSLINVAESLLRGTLTFTPVNPAKEKIDPIKNATILYDDFMDSGAEFNKILEKTKVAKSGLPLSPIDYMISKIENAKRESWDYQYATSENYIVEEVTKRQMTIKPIGNKEDIEKYFSEGGEAKFNYKIADKKSENDTKKVKRFNRGDSDVVILNTAGSTGLSLHSSIEFYDLRPRKMFIHQVELDVNTEVQKRGRINRTGQVNNPDYCYMVSVIPSEIRKLMMMRRKLRSLDANTTGNVQQSAKASQIMDSEGNEIEDMSNKYGYMALREFVQIVGNEKFADIMPNNWQEAKDGGDEQFDHFLRELEKMPCQDQEQFYNDMNIYYSKMKAALIEADEWDLDSSIEDLKSAIQNKKLLYVGNNDNEFTKSVYIEDKYVTPKGQPYTKEELEDAMIEMAGTNDHKTYYRDFVIQFNLYKSDKIKELTTAHGQPNYEGCKTEEEKEKVKEKHETKLAESLAKANSKLSILERYILYFRPDKTIQVPIDLEALGQDAWDDKGDRKNLIYGVGVVVGIKLSNKNEKNTFIPSNIEIQLASLSKIKPHLKITLTEQWHPLMDWIMGGYVSSYEDTLKRNWIVPKTAERDKMRVLTGELFKAFSLAEGIINDDSNYTKRTRLIKYTTSSGGVEAGIRLWLERYRPLTSGEQPISVSLNSNLVIDEIKKLRYYSDRFWLSSKKEGFKAAGYSDGKKSYLFMLCTGIYKRGRSDVKKPKEGYVSDFIKAEILTEITQLSGLDYDYEYVSGDLYCTGSYEWFSNMKFVTFTIREENLANFCAILHKVLNTHVLLKQENTEENYIIYQNIDADVTSQEENQKEGEYKYYPIVRFEDNNTIPNYIKGSFQNSDENNYGIITLRFPLNIIECNSYKVVPADITEAEAMQNILNIITDVETKKEFKKKVKELGTSYGAISTYTQSVIGINPKFGIGLVDSYYAGQIIAENIDVEESENPNEGGRKVETSSAADRQNDNISLDWESAQDFIIKLNSI